MIQDVDHEPNPAEVCSVRLLALDKSGRNKWAINHLPKIVAMNDASKKVTHCSCCCYTTTTTTTTTTDVIDFGKIGAFPRIGGSILISLVITVKLVINAKSQSQINAGI